MPDAWLTAPHSCEKVRLMLYELALILMLVAVNGLFAGAEIAIVGIDRLRLRQLVDEGRRSARVVESLRARPERFLATVQIVITVAGAGAGALGGATFAAELQPMLEPQLGRHAAVASLAAVVLLVSYLSLVLGELVPKSLALRYAERFALLIARPLYGVSWLVRPLVGGNAIGTQVPSAIRPTSPRAACRQRSWPTWWTRPRRQVP